MTPIFTSYEKLFATWMMHHDLNCRIEAQSRFPRCDQTQVMRGYYTVPEEEPAPKELPIEELRERRLARFASVPLSQPAILDPGRKIKQAPKPKPLSLYRWFVHGPLVQSVEKKEFLEVVKYGHFWGRTHFAVTTKQTGYFLVDGWLVVSIPKELDKEEFEFDSGTEITVRHKMDVADDPVSSDLIKAVGAWFKWRQQKLSNALAVGFGAALLLSLSVIALRGQPQFVANVLSRILLVASFAMQGLCLYAGFQLYRLYQLEEKMIQVNNLGIWVLLVRVFAGNYPEASIGAPIDDFFTSEELQNLNYMRNIDTSIRGTVGRFFKRIARNPFSSSRAKR